MSDKSIFDDKKKKELLALFAKSSAHILFDEPMERRTMFRIGGPADAFFEPATEEDIRKALLFCREQGISYTLIGNGSNILVADSGIRGLVLSIGQTFSGISIADNILESKAGTRLSALAQAAARAGLTGLEFASGIPGTLGGAVQMNAGAYGNCMQDIVVETDILDEEFEKKTVVGINHQFSYRRSLFSDQSYVILGSRLSLKPGEQRKINERMVELATKRRLSQPLEMPSAGSTFKRPSGYYAGQLISDCRLKGQRVGDAEVSEKHAGFIVNRGRATACDVRQLINLIQKRVAEERGVLLETEIKLIGDWPF